MAPQHCSLKRVYVCAFFNERMVKMIDINLIRENADLVKENIKKKFQDEKLPLVDEIKEMDENFNLYSFDSNFCI